MRIWEQEAASFLASPALLPLATLAASDTPNNLLAQIASQLVKIKDREQRENIAACSFILAGLRFDKTLINQLLTTDIMRESVTYQQILDEGREEGRKQGELALIIRQLTRRFGAVAPQILESLQALSIPELEKLAEVLLDFSQESDLTSWLDRRLQ